MECLAINWSACHAWRIFVRFNRNFFEILSHLRYLNCYVWISSNNTLSCEHNSNCMYICVRERSHYVSSNTFWLCHLQSRNNIGDDQDSFVTLFQDHVSIFISHCLFQLRATIFKILKHSCHSFWASVMLWGNHQCRTLTERHVYADGWNRWQGTAPCSAQVCMLVKNHSFTSVI